MAKVVIDFDGTVVTHEYPEIGRDVGAVPVLKRLVAAGHQLILFTMRSGQYLEEAVAWFTENDIPLFGVQRDPEQDSWTSSPKAYGNIIIDDAAIGCPLTCEYEYFGNPSVRPFVDWPAVEHFLTLRGLLCE